jgi:hypothetical protein
MNKLFSGALVMALMAAAVPGWAQSNPPQTGTQMRSDQSIAPGTGGVSKPDMPGAPGNKSGPTETVSGTSVPEPAQLKQSGDESHVQGLPGNKSGPAVKPSPPGR